MECEYFKKLRKFKYGELIAETKFWLIILAPDQRNLGTLVIALKRDESNLSGLNDNEWSEFTILVRKLESALKNSFPVTMFNWGCLLNSAYNVNPPQPHVHWHLIPRYQKPFEFSGKLFKDPCFGRSTMHARGSSPVINEQLKKKIMERISKHLNI
jgi:diadenosine tetraphosphate (Ap4A) HIT family hydrolase